MMGLEEEEPDSRSPQVDGRSETLTLGWGGLPEPVQLPTSRLPFSGLTSMAAVP